MYDPETIESYRFFLQYHGKGAYSPETTGAMSVDELVRHVERLHDQLKQEADNQREHNRRMQAQAEVARRRSSRR